jgi:hypothetical protein
LSTIFDFLNDILFSKKKEAFKSVDDNKAFSPYLINRWISMYSPEMALVINNLGKYISLFDNKIDLYNFFVAVIPKKSRKNISYIKKIKDNVKAKKDEPDIVALLSKKHEISKREIKEYLSIE